MPHGYTNHTVRSGSVVTKDYRGPDAARRCGREAAALAALAGSLPVPPLVEAGDTRVSMGLMAGVDNAGHAITHFSFFGHAVRYPMEMGAPRRLDLANLLAENDRVAPAQVDAPLFEPSRNS